MSSEAKVKPNTDIAVIGSGFGGLAAAIRLAAAGANVTMYEARDQPGGRAYVYRDQGFTFDAGPTVITAPQCLQELFELAGKNMADYVTLVPVTPFYRLLWDDGTSFDYVGDETSLVNQISQLAPDDVDGYHKFVAYSKRVYEIGYQELAATPFLKFSNMVKVAPDLIRLRADRSVYSTVAKFIKNEYLREALSFHSLLVGGNPFDTSSIYTLIHYLERKDGVWFAMGGTGALVNALVTLFQELGGKLRLSSPVTSVGPGTTKRHAVQTATDELQYDAVVSNADVAHTYGKLFASNKQAQKKAKKLAKADWSMSLFVLYFGTDRVYDCAHHTVVFGPRYEALCQDIFNGHELPADFSLYLHAPTVTDPSMAPAGGSSFYVLSPVPHLGNAAIDWATQAPLYADKILAALEKHLPDLRQHVVTKRWFTPTDFQSELAAFHGSAFSVAPRLTQSAYFRPHNRDNAIAGLYLVGAGTHPGAGVPGVVNSAKATASVVVGDFSA